jgi:hypothetical protein
LSRGRELIAWGKFSQETAAREKVADLIGPFDKCQMIGERESSELASSKRSEK